MKITNPCGCVADDRQWLHLCIEHKRFHENCAQASDLTAIARLIDYYEKHPTDDNLGHGLRSMGTSSQAIRQSLHGSLHTEVSCSEYRPLWQETGSLNNKGEFRQWLHIFCLEGSMDGVPSIKLSRVLPWVNLMPRPDLENLQAMWHMTKLAHFPLGWEHWNLHISETSVESRRKRAFGPYWMLLQAPGLQVLAQELVGLKRRIHNEMFRDADPWSSSEFERRVVESMEPFLIYPTLEKT